MGEARGQEMVGRILNYSAESAGKNTPLMRAAIRYTKGLALEGLSEEGRARKQKALYRAFEQMTAEEIVDLPDPVLRNYLKFRQQLTVENIKTNKHNGSN